MDFLNHREGAVVFYQVLNINLKIQTSAVKLARRAVMSTTVCGTVNLKYRPQL
jgi:hypothetical protein